MLQAAIDHYNNTYKAFSEEFAEKLKQWYKDHNASVADINELKVTSKDVIPHLFSDGGVILEGTYQGHIVVRGVLDFNSSMALPNKASFGRYYWKVETL